MIIACNATESNEAKTSSQTEITVTEIPKRATTDVRDSYVLFTIEANKNLSNYHLAVKEKGKTAPTTAEMTDGALKRNLSTNSINVLIAQRLNAPMVTFAKQYFSNSNHQILGTDMLKGFHPKQNFGLIYDGNATGTEAWIKESILKASTGYTLYGMKEGGNQIEVLQTFVTDPALKVPTTGPKLSYADSTLEKDYIEIAVNANELYIFPLQVQMNITNEIHRLDLIFSDRSFGDSVLYMNNPGEKGTMGILDTGYTDMLYLFKDMGSHVETYANGGIYLLTDTTHNEDSFYYGFRYILAAGGTLPTELELYTVLVKQQ